MDAAKCALTLNLGSPLYARCRRNLILRFLLASAITVI